MNCLSHAYRYLDDPYFVAGVCLPDWLGMIDRKVRVRRKDLTNIRMESDPYLQSVVLGILQHLEDDDRFHNSPAFIRVCGEVARQLAPISENRSNHFGGFASHILVELLLDASIEAHQPGTVHRYYQAVAQVCERTLDRCVNCISNKAIDKVPEFLQRYKNECFLFDYLEDTRLLMRLNGVLSRVGFEPILPSAIPQIADSRSIVFANRESLLNT